MATPTKHPHKSAWKKRVVSREVAALETTSGKLYKINNLPAETYTKRFDKAAKSHGFRSKKISFGRTIYYLGKGPTRVLITSGIHGEERSGPVGLLALLENTTKGDLIKDGISLMMCPLIGFDAWNNKKRFENGKINLNSSWSTKDEPDPHVRKYTSPRYVRELKKAIIRFRPTLYLDFHEDSTIKDNEPYLFRHKANRGLIYQLQQTLGVSTKKGLWVYPEYRGSAETFVFDTGCKETTTIETPLTECLRQRVGFCLAVLRLVLK